MELLPNVLHEFKKNVFHHGDAVEESQRSGKSVDTTETFLTNNLQARLAERIRRHDQTFSTRFGVYKQEEEKKQQEETKSTNAP